MASVWRTWSSSFSNDNGSVSGYMTGAALGRTAGHDVAELLSSAELKSVRAGEGEDALDVNVVVVNH